MALGQINIGIMTINGFEYHPNARFREEAVKSGHRIMLIDPYNMGCTLDPKGPGVFMDLDSEIPDLVMPRQGSPMGSMDSCCSDSLLPWVSPWSIPLKALPSPETSLSVCSSSLWREWPFLNPFL